MDVEVSVPDRHELLSAVPALVSAADEALLCVAFANQAGVRLLEGLTSGLLRNVEVAALLEGPSSAPPLAALWERAEALWDDEVSRAWEPAREPAVGDNVADDLWALLLVTVSPGTTARTVSDGKANHRDHPARALGRNGPD